MRCPRFCANSFGTLHNHARMWLASYEVHIRQVHWRAGADWLVARLDSADLAAALAGVPSFSCKSTGPVPVFR
ncbi:MAG: hypothetical protein HQ445_12175 [Polaromonas sp.]|nr:hypothetical protein [Polaromonas sp.]